MDATARSTVLTKAKLIDLVTYRTDGRPVSTPVAVTTLSEGLLIRTHDTAGKVKRLRHDPKVALTPIDMRRRHLGRTEVGSARILPASEAAHCLELIHSRHGLLGRVITVFRHVRGVRDVFIEVRLA